MNRREFIKVGVTAGGVIFLGLPGRAKGVTKMEAAVSHLYDIPGTIPIHVGLKRGFYREEGLDITWVNFAGGGETVRGVLTGGMPFGQTSVTAPIIAFEKGEDIRLVSGNDNMTPIVFVVRADSPLKKIQDLKGKKVGFSRPGAVTHYLVLKSLREAPGIDPRDVEIVPVGGPPAAWAAVKGGVVDAGWSSFPLLSKILAEGEARILWRSSDFIPDFVETGIMSSPRMIKEKGDIINAFLQAHQKAIDFVHKEPEETAKIWAEALKIPLEHAKIGVKEGTAGLSTKFSVKGLKAVEEGLLELKLIKKPVAWDKLLDLSLLDPAYRITVPTG